MSRRSHHTRREFLKDAAKLAGAASVAGLAGCFPSVGGEWPRVTEQCLDEANGIALPPGSQVSEVFCEASVVTTPRYELQADRVRPMLEAALGGLAGSLPALWALVFPDLTASTRIGIKVNCLNPDCATSVPLVKALVELLQETAGVGADRIVVWDRRQDELTRCGFSKSTVGATVTGTLNSVQDPGGPGYGEPFCGMVEGQTPRLSRLLTDLTDVTINVPVLKTHDVSGVTAAFKNIYGIIDNPGSYHDNLVTALPALYRLPPIRNRMRLHVLDAFQAVTTGGTSDPPDAMPKLIAVSSDPLALDNYSLGLANRLRAAKNLEKLGPVNEAKLGWMKGAFDAGLGKLEFQLLQKTI